MPETGANCCAPGRWRSQASNLLFSADSPEMRRNLSLSLPWKAPAIENEQISCNDVWLSADKSMADPTLHVLLSIRVESHQQGCRDETVTWHQRALFTLLSRGATCTWTMSFEKGFWTGKARISVIFLESRAWKDEIWSIYVKVCLKPQINDVLNEIAPNHRRTWHKICFVNRIQETKEL